MLGWNLYLQIVLLSGSKILPELCFVTHVYSNSCASDEFGLLRNFLLFLYSQQQKFSCIKRPLMSFLCGV